LTPTEVLDLAVRLKREQPRRTAAQICAIIARSRGDAPSARTLQRHFARTGWNRHPDERPPRSSGRFEAAVRNDRWTGDALTARSWRAARAICSRSSTPIRGLSRGIGGPR
jgi:putative transposase